MSNKKLLDKHYKTYRRNSQQDNIMREMAVHTISPFIKDNGIGLEIGCSDGYMTQMLASKLLSIDVVEGSGKFITEASTRNINNATFYHTTFEKFIPKKKYDYIFATYILTHIKNLEIFFKLIKKSLKKDGLVFFVVPNNRSISRQLALNMNIITSLTELTENDLNHGHVRSYNMFSLNNELSKNGFQLIANGGLMIKPLSDSDMDKLFDMKILGKEHIQGLYKLGQEYPDLCSACYSICKL